MTTLSRPLIFALYFLTITLPFYLLDQATKWAVLLDYHQPEKHLAEQVIVSWQWFCKATETFVVERTVVPDFFYLVKWRNTGAAFSVFSNSNRFFIGLSSVALVVLAVLAWRGKFEDRLSRVGWAFLLAGILGNLTDRIYQGSVVDFLLFDLHIPYANPWPAFNVADSCIFIAAALFIWQSFREPKPVHET